jgi:hypothetical protein
MAVERLILCGGVTARRPAPGACRPVELHIYGPDPNVRVSLEDIRRQLWKPLPAVFRDLLEVAAYVFAADQAVTRANGGRVDGAEIGGGWRRNLRFRIPVRRPDLWNSQPVIDALVATLSFASEDEYTFEFVAHPREPVFDGLLAFENTPFDGDVDEVMCFSGGIDSLAGAVEEAVNARRRVLLVNHRSNPKPARRHAALVGELERAFGRQAPLHVAAVVNKRKVLNREYTQRTRSFLFTALASTFAGVIGMDRVRFYENGVTSLNLPPSGQVVGARASRTTHPRVLAGYARLLTALLGKRFAIDSPFVTRTKADVVGVLRDAGCARLLALSTSCGHTWARTREHTHCGVCSQCVDRRFAVLAAGCAEHDPAERYAVDLLTGERPAGDPRVMLAGYVDLAERVSRMGAGEFYQQFGEAVRALPFLGPSPAAAGHQVYELYRRHATQVGGAITAAIRENADLLRRRTLPPSCLLRLVIETGVEVDPTGVATAPPPSPDGNYFLRRPRGYAVRFGAGGENVYPAERGFDLLRVLLAHPGRTFTASALDAECRHGGPRGVRAAGAGDAAAAGTGTGGDRGAESLDAEAVARLRRRLGEIRDARPRIEASGEAGGAELLDELAAEEHQIVTRLGRDLRPGGHSRVLVDVRDQIRNRVCNPIRRALKLVGVCDPPLAAHLTRPTLSLGHHLCYSPRPEAAWSVGE